MKKNIKRLIFLVILALCAFYLSNAMLRHSGYCFEQGRYLTTQEKFDMVATSIVISNPNYSSLEEFYAVNPNACELVKTYHGSEGGFFGPTFWNKVRGELSVMVRVFYVHHYNEGNFDQPVYSEVYYGLSNCGKVVPSEAIEKYLLFWPYYFYV